MTSIASGDKINFDFDIEVMKDLLQTIHSEDLIHRQPSEAQRSAYADTLLKLEARVVETEARLSKRRRCGRRLMRFLTCRDELYRQVVMLKSELQSVYSNLQNNAIPQIDVQEPTPERSITSMTSGSSSSSGLWMKGKAPTAGMAGERERGENEEMENADI